MASQVNSSIGYLDQWVNWAVNKRNGFFHHFPSERSDLPLDQEVLFHKEAALIISGITAGSLVVSHLAATAAKAGVKKSFAEYKRSTGVKLDENLTLEANNAPQSPELNKLIESSMFIGQMPIKYVAGWEANNARNGTGYLAAMVGTAGLVFLKIRGQTLVF